MVKTGTAIFQSTSVTIATEHYHVGTVMGMRRYNKPGIALPEKIIVLNVSNCVGDY